MGVNQLEKLRHRLIRFNILPKVELNQEVILYNIEVQDGKEVWVLGVGEFNVNHVGLQVQIVRNVILVFLYFYLILE